MAQADGSRRGLFITLEGGEGAGKSVQLEAVAACLRDQGSTVVTTREPGGTPLGERLRDVLLGLDSQLEPLTEAMLFAAARAQLRTEVIQPALDRGETVICDRYADSTVAYQGYGSEVDLMSIGQLNQTATGGLTPDLTVLLDIPVEDGLRRADGSDRFESEDVAFHERVRAGYLALAEYHPERWFVIDGTQAREAITEQIVERIEAVRNAT